MLLCGGGLAAVAAAAPALRPRQSDQSFADAFSSPFASLATADHTVWARHIGSYVQTAQGVPLRISAVERFAPFAAKNTGSTRPRAFMVSFELPYGGNVAGDVIHRLNHPASAPFDLFLTIPYGRVGVAQAVFS